MQSRDLLSAQQDLSGALLKQKVELQGQEGLRHWLELREIKLRGLPWQDLLTLRNQLLAAVVESPVLMEAICDQQWSGVIGTDRGVQGCEPQPPTIPLEHG